MDGNPTTRISFNTGGAAISFRYQDAAGWHSQPVSVANGVGTVDVGQLPSGTFGYELVAVTGGTSYAQSTGTFSLSHAGESFTLPVATVPGIYITAGGQLRWPVPSHAIGDVVFAWKPAGSPDSVWDTRYRPYRSGNEFVIDAHAAGVGSFDVGIVYTDLNPVTGNTVWTHAALG